MAKKKNMTKNDIISSYMEYVLEHNEKPKSVFSFAKNNNFEEAIFYRYYGSFHALEEGIFIAFFENTLQVLESSEDYSSFDAKNKLLTFYYTFFENLSVNRSYVVYALEGEKNQLKSVKLLSGLKKVFCDYIDDLDIKSFDIENDNLEKLQKKSIKESAWFQLLITLKFWLDDSSASFEKTDIFIEKSLKASFDLIDTTPLKSIIDFGKFLFKEKIHSK